MNNANKDIRWKQRFENFEKSYLQLQRTLEITAPSEAERAGLVQFFEITFELAWKLLKDYLEEQGFVVKSPKETIKQALQIDLIEPGHTWIDALADRNLVEHTYDEKTAIAIDTKIRNDYFPLFKGLYYNFKDRTKSLESTSLNEP